MRNICYITVILNKCPPVYGYVYVCISHAVYVHAHTLVQWMRMISWRGQVNIAGSFRAFQGSFVPGAKRDPRAVASSPGICWAANSWSSRMRCLRGTLAGLPGPQGPKMDGYDSALDGWLLPTNWMASPFQTYVTYVYIYNIRTYTHIFIIYSFIQKNTLSIAGWTLNMGQFL